MSMTSSPLYGSFKIDNEHNMTKTVAGVTTVLAPNSVTVDPWANPPEFSGFTFIPTPATPIIWPPPFPIDVIDPWLDMVTLEPFEVPLDAWGKPIRDPDLPAFQLEPKRKIRLED